MHDPHTLRFYDFYEAHLAAHQMESEGHRAEVYDWVYGMSCWPTAEYRMIVFEDGLGEEPQEDGGDPRSGEIDPGSLGQFIDAALRIVVCAGAIATVIQLAFWLLPMVEGIIRAWIENFASTLMPIAVSFALLVYGMQVTIAAYEGYRRGDRFWTGFMRLGILVSPAASLIALILLLGFGSSADKHGRADKETDEEAEEENSR